MKSQFGNFIFNDSNNFFPPIFSLDSGLFLWRFKVTNLKEFIGPIFCVVKFLQK